MGELVVQMQFCHVEETTSSHHSLHKQPTPPFPSTVMASIRDCHHHGDIDLTISKARNLAVVQWQVFGKQVRPLYYYTHVVAVCVSSNRLIISFDVFRCLSMSLLLSMSLCLLFLPQDPYVRVKVHGGSLGAKGVTTCTRSKQNGGPYSPCWLSMLVVLVPVP